MYSLQFLLWNNQSWCWNAEKSLKHWKPLSLLKQDTRQKTRANCTHLQNFMGVFAPSYHHQYNIFCELDLEKRGDSSCKWHAVHGAINSCNQFFCEFASDTFILCKISLYTSVSLQCLLPSVVCLCASGWMWSRILSLSLTSIRAASRTPAFQWWPKLLWILAQRLNTVWAKTHPPPNSSTPRTYHITKAG